VRYRDVGQVSLDGRRRLPLARLKLAHGVSDRYRVEEGPDGELRLIPIYSVTANELALLNDPEKLRRLQDNVAGEFSTFDAAAFFERALAQCNAEERAEAERIINLIRNADD
jgi:hypothetical protein